MNKRIQAGFFASALGVAAAGASLGIGLYFAAERDALPWTTEAADTPSESGEYFFSPRYKSTSAVDQVIQRVDPARDSFPTEQYYEELSASLGELSAWLRESPSNAGKVRGLTASEFRATQLTPEREVTLSTSATLDVFRAEFNAEQVIDGPNFATEFASFLQDYEAITVAEFHIVAIAPLDAEKPVVRTIVDYDLVGTGTGSWRLQKNGHWNLDWIKGPDGWRVLRWAAVDQTRSRARKPVFVDVSSGAFQSEPSYWEQLRPGVDHWRTVLDGAVGIDVFGSNGVSAGDIDGDGLDDFYVAQPSGLPNRLFRNRGDGTFADVTVAAGVDVLDPTSMSLFTDFDNDGDQDLIVITWQTPLLFVNAGDGKFRHKKDAFQFTRPPRGAFTSGCLADFDQDGDVDLYICSYTYFLGQGAYRFPTPYHDADNGPPNVLFRNNGAGRFQEVTAAQGMNRNNHRFSFACSWGDADQDGRPDLYVANDFARNNLYRNHGRIGENVQFRDEAAEAGVEDVGAGMSVTWFDYNNDQKLDLYVGNMWSSAGQRVTTQPAFQRSAGQETLNLYRRHARGNSLFQSRGDGTFREVKDAGDTEMGRWAWSCDALDFDNDGRQDLYITNGQITNTDSKDL